MSVGDLDIAQVPCITLIYSVPTGHEILSIIMTLRLEFPWVILHYFRRSLKKGFFLALLAFFLMCFGFI